MAENKTGLFGVDGCFLMRLHGWFATRTGAIFKYNHVSYVWKMSLARRTPHTYEWQ